MIYTVKNIYEYCIKIESIIIKVNKYDYNNPGYLLIPFIGYRVYKNKIGKDYYLIIK